MNSELTDRLSEQWRDALSAYVIHHVLPDKLQAGSLNMITAEHLDRYFMMDTQVTAKVKTTRLAEALACTQTYINSIFNNIEPGYKQDFAPDLIAFWQQAMANYSLWAANQMLEDYPENFIRAELRLDKTQLFQTLENDLGQGQITDAAVQSALLTYLNAYEYQNSIRVHSGYIDYRDERLEAERFTGHAFANSDYYLLGKDTASPPKYYWRKVGIRLDQGSTFVQPDAWAEWLPIDMPAGTTVLQARLVLFCGRLHLVWLHQGAPVSVDTAGTDKRYPLKLEVIHLGLDNQWSSPEELWSQNVEAGADGEFDAQAYQLLALALGRVRGSDDQLYVALRAYEEDLYKLQRDVLKREVGEQDFSANGRSRLFKLFEHAEGKLALQRRLSASDWWVDSVTPGEQNDRHTLLDALLTEHGEDSHMLQLRVHSSEERKALRPVSMQLSSGRLRWLGRGVESVVIRTTAQGGFELRCMARYQPDFQRMTLNHPDLGDVHVLAREFQRTNYGRYEAVTPLDLTSLMIPMTAFTRRYIRDGAGFSVSIDQNTPAPLSDYTNFITVEPDTVRLDDMELTIDGKRLWSGSWTLNGGASSARVAHEWSAGSNTLVCRFGQRGGAMSTFTITRSQMTSLGVSTGPYIHQQTSGTEFLVFDFIGGAQKPLAVRLNSQHVPDLINRAQASPRAVFAWDAQHLQEPPYVPDEAGNGYLSWQRAPDDPLMSLYDANGMYLRELFFHVPHLIASRLQEEERFEEARRWLTLVFDPQHRQAPTETPGVDYWNCAWLLRDDTPAAGLEHELVDPHAIALHAPSHYRKAVFMQYVRLLIGEADVQYRRQSRDSLANAWLLYRMAADLMGEAPQARAINTWQPKTVAALLASMQDGVWSVGDAQAVVPADLPKQLSTFFWSGVAAHPAFRLPVNRQLLDIWQLLSQRFHNLRHFLSIEGSPMALPLYAPAANPFDLLMARMGGNASLSHLMGYRTVVPPYRFRTLVAKAQEVVTTLMQLGEQLRGYMEQQERTELEALQFRQAAEIAGYTIAIQEQLLSQQQQTEGVLRAQRAATTLREAHYTRLYQENISEQESEAMSLHGDGRIMSSAGHALVGASFLAELAPNVFGLASGGMKFKGPLMMAGYALDIAGTAKTTAAELLRESQGYRRRREEWELQARLAGKEREVIDKQLEVQQHATLAAEQALVHSRTALAQAQQLYAFYQSKSTSVSLYRWLRSQATTWHATLFDVAVSLCHSAEACWQYETGNYDKRIIRTPVWQADRHGLNAGGELRLDLHRLEAEALLRNERHLELRKTVSLQALLTQGLVFDQGGEPIADWQALRDVLAKDGELTFSLSEGLYNQDYPGHYLRRLHSVALTLPALLGPYQNIRASLTQRQSRLLTRPDIEGVKFLSPELAQEQGDGRHVMMSLRARQQVCLSSADQDIGLFTSAETDDRYLPFEGTGAVSDWHLKFPRHAEQAELLDGLSDIVVDVQYFALHGGTQFEEQVDALMSRPAP
ncbi:neuraminidase-like domain-containing protein [Pseudomonas sp. GD03858]|uniref:Tc toxin subunit A-related protein n=1 Tax=unclassified Pseudomonas TaxID=196821 RepID=UPI00244B8552|nr:MULTISPECIES: neuraminidase-like domain-containing protein [unclassified Pseudomonas]MDH0647774.1 neuraminidase-like domain-containing protein [Pseudomonas sp. GD03867]MDH0663960.1 neuraminidase-like domain-containing protein [Pseudomonas sp. GD03858]